MKRILLAFAFASVMGSAVVGCTANVEKPTVDQTGRDDDDCVTSCEDAQTTCVGKCTDDGCKGACKTTYDDCTSQCG